MNIYLKYLMKNIVEKKSRLIILLITITLSTALLIGSFSIIESIIDVMQQPYLETAEGRDIIISPEKYGEGIIVDDLDLEGLENILPQISTKASEEEFAIPNLTIIGRDLEYLDELSIVEGKIDNDFTGNKCIISQRISQEKNLSVGDSIEVFVNGELLELEVNAIASNEGIFYTDIKDDYIILMPYEKVFELIPLEEGYQSVKASISTDDIDGAIDLFEKNNKGYTANKLFDTSIINNMMSQINVLLLFMFLFVALVSCLIIYSAFKLLVTERLNTIGTFLSQGATKGTVKILLVLESAIYGVFGGILGSLGGYGIIYIVGYFTSPLRDYGIYSTPQIPVVYYIYGIAFAIFMSVISSVIPIKEINKIEVKDLVLNDFKNHNKSSSLRFFIGLLLFIGSFIYSFLKFESMHSLSPVILIIYMVSILMVTPTLIRFISSRIYKITKYRFPTLSLALNNVATLKILLGNVTLLIIALFSAVIINSVSISLKEAVTGVFDDLNFDIELESGIYPNDNIDEVYDLLANEPGIIKESIQKQYGEFIEIETTPIYMMGIDQYKYVDFDKYIFDGKEEEEIFDRFSSGGLNQCIVSTSVADDLSLKENSTLEIEFNNKTVEFEVVGMVDGKLMNGGALIFVKEDAFEELFEAYSIPQFICDTSEDAAIIKDNIEEKLNQKGYLIYTFEEKREWNLEMNQQMMDLLNVFSILAIIISAIGVVNNLIICFIQRKKSIVVLTSVGLTMRERRRMILLESTMIVIWAVAIVSLFSAGALSILTEVLIFIRLPFEVVFNYQYIPSMLMASLIIVILATIPVLIKSGKMSIIEEIKYE